MRILRGLLACLSLAVPSYAFARGGPVGAIAGMLDLALMLAIIGGVIAGAVYGRMHRHTPWTVFALTTILLIAVGLIFPYFWMFLAFFSVPGLVFAAVFVSIADISRNGLRRIQTANQSPPDDRTRWHSARWTEFLRHVFRWLGGTYVFWTVFAFANFELLDFLTIPPIIIAFPAMLEKFLPFILPPLAVAIGAGITVTLLYSLVVRKKAHATPYLPPLIFNLCVLFVFFTSAEMYSRHLMSQDLLGHTPSHFQRQSFLDSVLSYRRYFRGSHACFDEEGKTYCWSYSERKFYQTVK